MELSLSQNIRSLRKQRKLTQEQFAEILGVTTGSVYKWESGSSIPELYMLVEIADFFGVSMDALLGYQMRDSSLIGTKQRLSALCRKGDPEALTEAEKTLKRFPNTFEAVYACALVYRSLGMDRRSRELLSRARELLEQALLLISQNNDPGISESTIWGQIGGIWLSMGEAEKGVEILKRHNAGGVFNSDVGLTLSMLLHRAQEARGYLSDSLIGSVFNLMNTVVGYAFMYSELGDYAALREIVTWGQGLMLGLRKSEDTNFLDKTNAALLALMAHAQLHEGKAKEARRLLREAAAIIQEFDAAPDYGIGSIRFAEASGNWSIHDMLGGTAKESVEHMIAMLRDKELSALWRDTTEGGNELSGQEDASHE